MIPPPVKAAIAAGAVMARPAARITTPIITASSLLDPDGHNIEAVCHAPE
jgi:hypothetical protein